MCWYCCSGFTAYCLQCSQCVLCWFVKINRFYLYFCFRYKLTFSIRYNWSHDELPMVHLLYIRHSRHPVAKGVRLYSCIGVSVGILSDGQNWSVALYRTVLGTCKYSVKMIFWHAKHQEKASEPFGIALQPWSDLHPSPNNRKMWSLNIQSLGLKNMNLLDPCRSENLQMFPVAVDQTVRRISLIFPPNKTASVHQIFLRFLALTAHFTSFSCCFTFSIHFAVQALRQHNSPKAFILQTYYSACLPKS